MKNYAKFTKKYSFSQCLDKYTSYDKIEISLKR